MFDTYGNPQGAGASMGPTAGSPASKASLNPDQSKVSLSELPPGAKVGDTVEVKIKSIDKASNCAYVVSSESEDETPTEDSGETPTAEESEPKAGQVNTGLLMGPMDKLKNYLAKTSVDHQTQM